MVRAGRLGANLPWWDATRVKRFVALDRQEVYMGASAILSRRSFAAADHLFGVHRHPTRELLCARYATLLRDPVVAAVIGSCLLWSDHR